MIVRVRNSLFACFGFAAAVAASPSCVDNNESIFVKGVLYNQPPSCIVTASESADLRFSGTLDLGFTNAYSAPLEIGNQLYPGADPSTTRVETNVFQVTGADITLRDAAGNDLVKYGAVVQSTGNIPPGTGGDATFGVVSIQLIPPQVTLTDPIKSLIAAAGPSEEVTLQIAMRVYGQTLSGENITAPEYVYEVTTCYGCSVSFAKATMPAGTGVGGAALPATTCFGNQTSPGTLATDFCNLGQDDVQGVSCGDCQGIAACTLCTKDSDCVASGIPKGTCITSLGICHD
jgi:hypothetical protein